MFVEITLRFRHLKLLTFDFQNDFFVCRPNDVGGYTHVHSFNCFGYAGDRQTALTRDVEFYVVDENWASILCPRNGGLWKAKSGAGKLDRAAQFDIQYRGSRQYSRSGCEGGC